MSGRMLPWLLLAAAVLIGIYYFYSRPPEVVITVPREKGVPSEAIPPPPPSEAPSPSGDAAGRELSPPDATARDAGAAMRQLEHDQQQEVGKPSLYPDTMDKDLRNPPPGEPKEKR